MSPITRQIIIAIGTLLAILITGIIGFMAIEGWTLAESFYMSVITVTTVGFSEVHPLGPAGRLFTVFLILAGFSLVAMLASQMAQLIFESDLRKLLWTRKMKKMISKLSGHYLICGYGRVGSIVCNELHERGVPYAVIDQSEDAMRRAREKGFPLIQGDALTDESLEEGGIERAVGLISVLNRDSDNLLVALSARELNHNIHIIARGESPDIENKLLRAGADVVVSPFRISGQHIADLLLTQTGRQHQRSQETASDHISGFQLQTLRGENYPGRTIAEILSESGAVQAVAVLASDKEKTLQPPPDHILTEKELLIVIMHKDAANRTTEKGKTGEDRKTILVVDDHDAMRKLMVKKLRTLGYHVLAAESGREALESISEDHPHLLVLDAMMPGMSGFEVCKKIKENSETNAIKVVIFSNMDSKELQKNSAAVQADAIISKTARSKELTDIIEKLLSPENSQ